MKTIVGVPAPVPLRCNKAVRMADREKTSSPTVPELTVTSKF